jgi:hypothetical protein
MMMQIVDRQQRIFLGAPQDEPGDHVDDPHFSRASPRRAGATARCASAQARAVCGCAGHGS